MIVSLAPGDTLKVMFHDGFSDVNNELHILDGSFTVSFEAAGTAHGGCIRVEAELPDASGRTGTIYEELFVPHDGVPFEKAPLDDMPDR